MNKKNDFEIRLNPENRVCSKFNLQSLATFPIIAPTEISKNGITDPLGTNDTARLVD